MHSVIRLATREQRSSTVEAARESKHAGESKDARGRDGSDDADDDLWKGGVCNELLRRENVDRAARAAAQSMEIHAAVAPLQWICLVCVIELHALEASVSGAFMGNCGGQILRRWGGWVRGWMEFETARAIISCVVLYCWRFCDVVFVGFDFFCFVMALISKRIYGHDARGKAKTLVSMSPPPCFKPTRSPTPPSDKNLRFLRAIIIGMRQTPSLHAMFVCFN